MSESDQKFEEQQENKRENSHADPYVSESGSDIYTTPEVVETSPVTVVDTHGLFSGNQQQNAATYQPGYGGQPSYNGGQNPYGSQPGNYGEQTPYGSQPGNYGEQTPYGSQPGNYGEQTPYSGQTGGGGGQPQSEYDGQFSYNNGQNPYGSQPVGYGEQAPYGSQPGNYGEQAPYSGQTGGGSGQLQPGYDGQFSYNNGQNPYGSQPGYGQPFYNNGQNPYGSQSGYGQPFYNNGQNPYGSQAGGGYGGQPPFGGQPPYDNPYSPYAAPRKKQHTGLIVGIVVAIILLFLVAVFALASRAVHMLSERERENQHHDVYDFYDDYDDEYDYDYDDTYDYEYEYEFDPDEDYGYYDYDYGYSDDEYDDRYYTLQQDLKYDLDYEMDIEDYEYETDYDNVLITASIPVISGEEVPNLDKLNEGIRKEVDRITELFEKDYEAHIKEDEDSYFGASMVGYVTYMDEDRLSVVYQEELYNDLGGGVYLISVNIDMKSGVILDNEEMLTTDDEFSVDFRQRSEEQNGEIDYLYYMTDQQITEYFNSDNIIVFYTPKGMEIGFNYEEGWVTVTYEDYEQYLKVF